MISLENHVADLFQLEGHVIHWSASENGVYLSLCAEPSGTPVEEEPPMIFFDSSTGEGMSLRDALRLAQTIVNLAEKVRR